MHLLPHLGGATSRRYPLPQCDMSKSQHGLRRRTVYSSRMCSMISCISVSQVNLQDRFIAALTSLRGLTKLRLQEMFVTLDFRATEWAPPAPSSSLKAPRSGAQKTENSFDCVIAESGMRWLATKISQFLPNLQEISVGDEACDYFGSNINKRRSWTLEVQYHVRRDYLGMVLAVSGSPQFGRK